MNNQHAAEVLFGGTPAAPAADDATDTTSASDQTPTPATALFGSTSAGRPGAWTTNETERALFGDDYPEPREIFSPEVALRPVMHERHDDVMTVLQLGKEERIQRHRDFVAAIRNSGLDPNVTGQALYGLMTDAEVALARGETKVPVEGAAAAAARLPPRMVEDVLRGLRSRIGAERGERLVVATNEFVEAHPGLAKILATPGVVSRPGFRPVLDSIIEHVRTTQRI